MLNIRKTLSPLSVVLRGHKSAFSAQAQADLKVHVKFNTQIYKKIVNFLFLLRLRRRHHQNQHMKMHYLIPKYQVQQC